MKATRDGLVVQEDGSLACSVGGELESGPLRELGGEVGFGEDWAVFVAVVRGQVRKWEAEKAEALKKKRRKSEHLAKSGLRGDGLLG